jgi:hypothetical protein
MGSHEDDLTPGSSLSYTDRDGVIKWPEDVAFLTATVQLFRRFRGESHSGSCAMACARTLALAAQREYADMLDREIALRAAADAIIEDAANTPPPDHSKHRKTFLGVCGAAEVFLSTVGGGKRAEDWSREHEKPLHFLSMLAASRPKIAAFTREYFEQRESQSKGLTLLTSRYSSCVVEVLRACRELMALVVVLDEELRRAVELEGIPCRLVSLAAVGGLIQSVDAVLVGGEAVSADGGLVGSAGTLLLALAAGQARRPFYTAVEAYKWRADLLPVRQSDLQRLVTPEVSEGDDEFSPAIDFTPPELISMHFTDLGAITPAGLSERVISLRMSKVAGT